MKSTDVLVIGGSAAGLASALASKSHYPEKRVTLVRKESKAAIPCGIPYIFGSLENTDQDILPDAGLIKAGVEIVIDLIIQNKLNVNSLLTAQIGTHPMLTASPAAYPLTKAAELIAKEFWHN